VAIGVSCVFAAGWVSVMDDYTEGKKKRKGEEEDFEYPPENCIVRPSNSKAPYWKLLGLDKRDPKRVWLYCLGCPMENPPKKNRFTYAKNSGVSLNVLHDV
jgi:hypothetical protein